MKFFSAILILGIALELRVVAGEMIADFTPNSLGITPAWLNQLAEEARTNNPSQHAAATRIAAAEASRSTLRTWDDPELIFGVAPAPTTMRRENGDLVYGVEQKLPLWGKPRLAREVAQAEIEREEAQASYEFQMLRLEIARQVFRTGLADHAVEIGREDLAWLETMTRTAEDRYGTGEGSQLEVLRLRNERSKRSTQLITEERQRDQERVQLNRWLARPLTNPWPRLTLPTIAPPIEFTERLQKLTLNNEARLKVLHHEAHHALTTLKQTEKRVRPEIGLGVEGRQYSGDGEFKEGLLTLRINWPLFNRDKYRAEIERDRARLRVAEAALADYQLFVPTEARRIVTRADAARREALLYRDEIIPRSQLALASAHTAWVSHRSTFLDVMEARRMLLEAQLTYTRAVAEQYAMLAELTLCCGAADLEALQILGAPADSAKPPLNEK